MTEDEFSRFNGLSVDGPFSTGCEKFKSSESDLPDSYDWRDHNAVTPVKDQGQCDLVGHLALLVPWKVLGQYPKVLW